MDTRAGQQRGGSRGSRGRAWLPLQPGLRAAWKAADGSGTASLFIRSGYLTTYAFLPLADALEERESRRRIAPNYEGYENPEPRDPRIRPGWFQEGWVLFASFAEGTALLMADHSPAEGGQVGQVIAYTHDPDEISYVAPDWPTFLQLSLQEITADPEEFLEIGF